MANNNVSDIKEHVLRLIQTVNSHELHGFLKWLGVVADEALASLPVSNSDVILEQIQDEIRQALPLNALMPSEKIELPTSGQNADCVAASTVHVDSFLYSDDAIDALCDDGLMSRNYCRQCGSQQVAPLTFISHSCSTIQVKYIFQFLLKDQNIQTLLDVGSRTGALLYGAYLYSNIPALMGVELNSEFCQLQQNIVQKYQLQDRLQVICADICTQAVVLNTADVVILNNVFECFAPVSVQQRIWCFLRSSLVRTGTVLVTCPSLHDSLQHLQTEIKVESWVKPVDIKDRLSSANVHFYGAEEPDESELSVFHVYQVI